MKRICDYSGSLCLASGGRPSESVPEESSGFSRALLLVGVTMFGFAGGSLISGSLWAGFNAQQSQAPAEEDLSGPPSYTSEPKKTRLARNYPGAIYQTPRIELNIIEPPFPVLSELEENMSPEDVLAAYGQPHLTMTQMEHGQTIQRFVYIGPDLHSTSVIFKGGKIVGAYGSSVHGN